MSKMNKLIAESTFLQQGHLIHAGYVPHALSISIHMDRNPSMQLPILNGYMFVCHCHVKQWLLLYMARG